MHRYLWPIHSINKMDIKKYELNQLFTYIISYEYNDEMQQDFLIDWKKYKGYVKFYLTINKTMVW